MNVLGIEYRRAYTVVALREGSHPPRLVGDGRRAIIPNASGPGERWGSAAEDHCNDVPAPGPWLGDAAVDYWRGLGARIVRFLGGLQPVDHGYDCVIACSGAEAETRAVGALAQAGGLGAATIITPGQAALARWLAASAPTSTEERTVAVVTIGDATAEAAAFVARTGSRPALVASADGGTLTGVGASVWARRLLNEVAAQLPDPLDESLRLVLGQAALEFAGRLRQAGPTALLRWNGPLEDCLVSPLRLSAEDLFDWPEIAGLAHWLPTAVQEGLRRLGRARADVLVVAGLGAVWPLPATAFLGLPAPAVSADPGFDIALGATSWPRLLHGVTGLTPAPALALPSAFDGPIDLPMTAPALPGGMSQTELSRLLDDELKD